MKNLLLSAVFVFLGTAVFAGIARHERTTPMSIDKFLTDFDNAITSADTNAMERLFLPPDDSADGQNRQSSLTELRKDWRNADSGPSINLAATRAVIKLEMTELDPGGPPTPHVSDIELKLVRTDDGWRIEAMR